jgi:hypothetical protein
VQRFAPDNTAAPKDPLSTYYNQLKTAAYFTRFPAQNTLLVWTPKMV